LVTLGLSERTAVGLLLTLGVLGGTTAVLARLNVVAGVWIGAPLIVVTLAFLGVHLAKTDRVPDDPSRVNLLSAFAAFGYRRRIFEVVLDAVLAMVALVAAFLLRFDGTIPGDVQHGLSRIFVVVVAAKLGALYAARAYDGVWRYVDTRDLLRLIRAAAIGSIVVAVVVGVWLHFTSISRGALVIDALVFAVLIAGSRLSFRLLRVFLDGRSEKPPDGKRVLLWGAGDLGESVARRLLDQPEEGLIPVGFVDDDPLKRGRIIHGLPVHGDSSRIQGLLEQGLATMVVVTTPRILTERVAAVAEQVGPERVRRFRLLLEEVVPSQPRQRLTPEPEMVSVR
jgi:UDP-GlcNAc:undecaprenyl-phosphate GlcNAc-1-phosphate transferase